MSSLRRIPDLTSLELLLAVAERGSLGKAATQLGITQSAASARVRAMEQQIGVGLVERSFNGSRLTPAGALVAGWAGPFLEHAASLDAGIDSLRARRDNRLRVTASLTIAEYLLPPWLVVLRQERPGTAIALSVDNSRSAAEKVLTGEAHIGFIEGATVPPGLDATVIATDRLVVVAAPHHPWARRRAPVTAQELARTPLIMREQGSGTRQVLARALAAHGGPETPSLELASTAAVKAATVSGAGPAVMSSLSVQDDVRARRLAMITVDAVDLTRSLRAVWPTGQRLQGPAGDLLAIARRPS
ncbi:LysR family transcriptional regulator [Streptomyces sp. NPDC058877]|uniref:LysR family transcriptional regulator n=1 Tax=Streptomyces sp. NPDC058877 TaxID=3346665 RepID=UPI00368F4A82